MKEKYIAPKFEADAFHCPHCGVYAHQIWFWRITAHYSSGGFIEVKDLSESKCSRCKKYVLWIKDKILYPTSPIAPLPLEDIPKDVKEDFIEARNIVNASPRAAAALLRLALQKLMVHLGEKGENLNEDIANLVKKGLPPRIQKALDLVRVIGNNAVHPGIIDLKDDKKTAISLFELLNITVEFMITQPNKVDKLYNKIPDSTKKAIKERDKKE